MLAEANRLAPGRDRRSDGTIGDAKHRARVSDHNPAADGYVYAGDLDHDPVGGLDAHAFAAELVRRRDPRVKYVITRGRMASSYPAGGYPAWAWRPYYGSNGHFEHVHVSIHASHRDDLRPWWPQQTPTTLEDDPMYLFRDERTGNVYLRDGGDTIHLSGPAAARFVKAGVRNVGDLPPGDCDQLLAAAKQ